MAQIKAKVNSQQDLRIRSRIEVSDVESLKDIDTSNLTDGSVLVYSSSTGKWESTTLLEKQTVECGQY